MMTVLVTGASGFLGSAVVSHLRSAGFSVRAAVRNAATSTDGGEVVIGDLGDEGDLSWALAHVNAVVHCAARAHVLWEAAADPLACFRAANTAATLRLARSAAVAGVRRFVFISSIGVNGSETFGRPFTAADPPRPHTPYATSKYEAEEGLKVIQAQTGLEVVIIRPPLIIGPDPKGNLGLLKTVIDRGWPAPFGLLTSNRRDLVSLSTVCGLIEACLVSPAASGEIFLVSDGAALSTRRIVEALSAYGGRRPVFFPVPRALLSVFLRLTGRAALRSQLLGDLEIDIRHTQSVLGWAPACSSQVGGSR